MAGNYNRKDGGKNFYESLDSGDQVKELPVYVRNQNNSNH